MGSYDDYFLPLEDTKQKQLFESLLDTCFDFYSGKTRGNKFLQYKSPDELKSLVEEDLPSDGVPLEQLLDILEEKVGKYSIAQFDPEYLAFPDAGNAVPAIWADIYAKFINQNMIAFSRSAPVATFIEIQLIEWLRQLIGYEYKPLAEIHSLSEVSGMITTGGHMSNHIAIMAALNHAFPEIKTKGLNSLNEEPAVILSGAISHYSFSSAMHHLGIGQGNLLISESTSEYTTDVASVEQLLVNPPAGKKPFMVVGVAGNSRTTSIDDLRSLAKLCKKHNVWFHTDACHGGTLLFSPKHRKMLAGIEESDSVSLDPHKGLFSPYPLSFVMFKQRDTLTKFTRYEKEARDGSAWDLGYITPFYGSRGFESLKMWLTIKAFGLKGLEKIINDRQVLASQISDLVVRSGYFAVFNEMSFYRMVFVYYPENVRRVVTEAQHITEEQKRMIKGLVDHYTHLINDALYTSGELCLDEFKLHDLGNFTGLSTDDRFVVMSITMGNPKQTLDKVRKALKKLFNLCQRYTPEMQQKVEDILHKNLKHEVESGRLYGPAGWQ